MLPPDLVLTVFHAEHPRHRVPVGVNLPPQRHRPEVGLPTEVDNPGLGFLGFDSLVWIPWLGFLSLDLLVWVPGFGSKRMASWVWDPGFGFNEP